MKKFGFLDVHWYPDCDFHEMDEICRAAGYEFKKGTCKTTREIIEFAADCEVICTGVIPITAEVIEALPDLKGIIRFGIGFDALDVETATKHNVIACNLPTYCLEDVATMTVGFVIDLVRKITFYDRSCRRGEWNVAYGNYGARRLSSLTMGLIGFGNIARHVYQMLEPLGMRLIAYDPYLPDEVFREAGCERVGLDELYARSDVISIHVPATEDTIHLIDDEAIARMKDGVLLVNTARGKIVSEPALMKGLESGKIAGAALDVVEFEPITEADYRLYQYDNIIVTPHISYNTLEAQKTMHVQTAETAVKIMRGELPQNRLNFR